jgi:hypothetical protein
MNSLPFLVRSMVFTRALPLLMALVWPAHAWAQATPASVQISVQPIQTVAGETVKPAGGPSVVVRDSLNNLLSGVNVTVALNGGSFAAGTTTVATDAGGVAAFAGLVINSTKSDYTLTFTAGSVSVTSAEFPVVPAAPAQAAVTTQPANTVYGSPVAGVPVVTISDAFGNAVRQGVNITATLGGGSFRAGSTVKVATDTTGRATFSNLVPRAAGSSYTITFLPAAAGVPNAVSDPFDVSPLELTIGGNFTANNKVYDATDNATIASNLLTLQTPVSGDDVLLSGVQVVFAQADAGTGIAVSINSAILTGADKDNYTLTLAGAPTTSATITRAPLTIQGSFSAGNKVYDGTTTATIATNSLELDGVVNAEDVTLNAVANFAQSGIGTGITVNLLSSTIGGTANLSNYSFTTAGSPTTTANITAKTLTIGGSFSAANKVYDGTTAATITTDSLTLVGVIGSDAVTLNQTANFAQSGIGTGISVGLLSSTLGGAGSGNYTLSFAGAPTATADITAKPLTITGSFAVANKAYDGTTAATITTQSLSLSGVLAGETVNLTPVANFAEVGPGTAIPVDLESSSISGADAGNYVLSLAGAPTTTADITARLVTIRGSFTADNKVYDGTTLATIAVNSLILEGLAPGDSTTSLSAVANFSQAAVGNALNVSLGDSTLSGPQASGYTLSFAGAPVTTANITKKELTVGGGFTAQDKVYNGNTTAAFGTDNLSLVGVVGGDDVSLANKQIAFADKNIGVWTVSLVSADLIGAGQGNYSLELSGAPTTTATISALELTIGGSFTAQNKPYDGNTAATINAAGLTLLTPVAGDVVDLTGVTAVFAQAAVGTGITVSITGASLTGAQAGNYTVNTTGAPTTTANITALTLTIGGTFTADDKVYDGTTAAAINGSGLSLVGTIVAPGSVTLNAVGNFTQSNVGTDITVNLASSILTGSAAANYTLSFSGAPTTTADITVKALTITIGNSSVEAGQGVADLNPKPTVVMTGLVAADTEADITGTPVVYTSVVLPATTAAEDYPDDLGVATNGTKAGNYDITQVKGTLTIEPAAADQITIIADPIQTTAGQVLQGFPTVPTVEVTDAYGNTVPGFQVLVALNANAFADGSTTIVATGSDGRATFDNLTINASGTAYYLIYSGLGVTSVESEQFSIIAAAARDLLVLQQPTDRQAGETLTPAPSVQLTDEYGNPVLVGPYAIDASLTPAASIIGTTSQSTSSLDGTATFTGISIRKAGTYVMNFTPRAAGINVATSANFTISAQLSSASISVATQPVNTVAGVAISPSPAALVNDQFLNPVPGYEITAALNTGSFAAGTTTKVTTGADGLANFGNLKINAAAEGYALTFSFVGAPLYGSSSVTSDAFNITHAALSKFAFANVANQTAGSAFNLAITAQDEFGNTVSNFVGTANLTLNKNTFASGGGATGNFVNGVLAAHAVSINTAATSYEVTATSGAITGQSNLFNVSPAAAASITLTGPASVVAGATSTAFTVTVRDAFGNTAPVNASTTFTLTTSQQSATATFTPASLVLANGASTGTFTYLNTKVGTGSHLLTAAYNLGDTGLSGRSASATITVSPASAAKLAITAQPSPSAAAGVAFAEQPLVRLLDQFDNNVPQSEVSVVASIASGDPALEGTAVVTTDTSGVATFTNLAIGGLIGERTLSFGAEGLTSVTSSPIMITAGAPATLTVVVDPTQTSAGEAISPAPSVRLTDAYGNPLVDKTVQVALTTPTGAGAFAGGSTTAAVTDATGLATFTNLKITTAFSPYRLAFSIGAAAVQSRQFAVIGGTPTRLEMVQQPPTGTAGAALAPAPSVKAFDEFDNAVAEVRVKVTLTGASFAAGTTDDLRTNTGGIASFSNLKINTAGTGYTLTFTTFVAGAPSVTSAAFEIKPDYNGAVMTMNRQPGTTTAGSAVAGPPRVTVKDQFNNNITGMDVSVTLSSGSFTGASTTKVKTSGSGLATFSNLRIEAAGSYSLSFRLDTFAAQVTSNSFTVNPAAAARLSMLIQPSSIATAGVAFATQPSVRLQDSFGNNVSQSDLSVTVEVESGAGTLAGTLTATTNAQGVAAFTNVRIDGATGSRTLQFSSSDLAPVVSSTVTVGPGAATALAITRQPLLTVAGESILSSGKQSLAVRATDAFGNNVPGVSIAPEANGFFFAGAAGATITDSAGLATFDALSTTEAGVGYTITFRTDALLAASAEFNVVPATPASLIVLQQPLSGVVDLPLRPAPKVQLADRFGNPTAPTTPYNIGVTIDGASFTGGSITRVVTAGDGTAIFDDLVPAEEAIGAVLNFDIDGQPVANSAPFNILGGGQDPEAVSFVLLQGSREDLLAGAERTFTAQLMNAQGVPVSSGPASSGPVTFAQASSTGGTLIGLGTINATNGLATIVLTGGNPGEVILSASYDGLNSDTVEFTVIGPEVRIINFTAAGNSPVAEGEMVSFAAEDHALYELTFEITPGARYEVQSCISLGGDWETVLEGDADAAELSVVIPVTHSQRHGFWRVRAMVPSNGL